MIQKSLNEENQEITDKAYEIYQENGSKDGKDAKDWLEAERQLGKQTREHNSTIRNLLLAIIGLLCLIIILMLSQFFYRTEVTLSKQSLYDLESMMEAHSEQGNNGIATDAAVGNEFVMLGDTHFDFDQFTITAEAKTLLDKDVLVLKENPGMHVRMAGYTSATGSEEVNQQLSEQRASAVRDYLVEKGVASERITIIGYGRTKPALYEANPADVHSAEAKANMRVLFEVVVE
jgi:outer membrane protein OmpA-like peptidoglycan-associated protein